MHRCSFTAAMLAFGVFNNILKQLGEYLTLCRVYFLITAQKSSLAFYAPGSSSLFLSITTHRDSYPSQEGFTFSVNSSYFCPSPPLASWLKNQLLVKEKVGDEVYKC